MTTDDGGPAFPVPEVVVDGNVVQGSFSGASLRDFFAAAALPEEMRATWKAVREDLVPDDGWRDAAALGAYIQADAMLKARNS